MPITDIGGIVARWFSLHPHERMARASVPKMDSLSKNVLVELLHQPGDYVGVIKYDGQSSRGHCQPSVTCSVLEVIVGLPKGGVPHSAAPFRYRKIDAPNSLGL